MSDTLHSLTDDELKRLKTGIRIVSVDPTLLHPERTRHYVDLILRTGMQPCILSDPASYRLTVELAYGDTLRLRWERPKKPGGSDAGCFIYLDGKRWKWLSSFISDLHRRPDSIRSITRYIEKAGAWAGIPGTVSPRTLRHTAIRLALDRGMSRADAIRFFHVGPRVLDRYGRDETEWHHRMKRVMDSTPSD